MPGPLPPLLAPLTVPASWAYGALIAARNRRYDRGRGVQQINLPVISIGNITTGGTGKTPMVAWIAERLIEAGHQPVIAMRGYGARPSEMSDEQAEYAERLPGVPVLANADRVAALRQFLPMHPHIDCVLLDDGFQHRQVKRDLDLVLIDASADTFNDRLLPAGHLREPLGNLHRADAVILTRVASTATESQISNLKSPQISNLRSQVLRHHGQPPLAACEHVWTSLQVHSAGGCESVAPVWLCRRRVLTMLGVGHPSAVRRQIESAGATIVADVSARDHEHYTIAKVATARGLAAGGDAMLVTAKDWVKLRPLIDWSAWPVPIVVPQLALEFTEGEDNLRRLILDTLKTHRI